MIVVKIILFFIFWALIERKQLVTVKYKIISTRLPEQLNGTSFVVLADLHNQTFGKYNERLIKQINKLTPEFIIVAGDMINKKTSCYPSNAFTLLETLSKKYKIYYAYGNHEQKMELGYEYNQSIKEFVSEKANSTWVEYKEKLIKSNITFLNNESVIITKKETKFRITGISIGQKYFERNKIPQMQIGYLNDLVGRNSKEDFQILIAHNPVYFNEYASWGADLTLSGHLHGGMIRLPGIGGIISPQVKFFPKYDAGKYTKEERNLVVSRGLGSHSIMPRLFNIPELVFVSLQNSNVNCTDKTF